MKTKKASRTKIKPRGKQSARSSSVLLVHAKHPVFRHFKLVEHKHTGKLVKLRHTSHLALGGVLLITGFFILASDQMVSSVTSSGLLPIGVVVPGSAPTIGASITSPSDGARFNDQSVIEVSGTCSPEAFVVVKSNDMAAGSTVCTTAGIFVINVQLYNGTNKLSALNYDNLNQVGPPTPSVTVHASKPPLDTGEALAPVVPSNPSVISGLQTTPSQCSSYEAGNLTAGGPLHIAVACVPRLFTPKISQIMGLLVWGGAPPYALSIDFYDDNDHVLVSISEPKYVTKEFYYEFPGIYKIDFKLTDNNGQTAIIQTAVQANGALSSSGEGAQDVNNSNPVSQLVQEVTQSGWLKSPVPFYMLAVAITLGFWGGDIFVRRYGAVKVKLSPKKRRTA